MSRSQAIAAVTNMLDYLITQKVDFAAHSAEDTPVEKVTTLPPDKARTTGDAASQINIFLYHTEPNAAWRNMDLPGSVRPGESGTPPLALDLYYLITAYGSDDNDISAHLILGQAMQTLHDHGIVRRQEIVHALELKDLDEGQRTALRAADLQNQVEALRITPLALPLDELSRLWSTFMTAYRISAAYQVSVVLIESARPVKAPLPVLSRGRIQTVERNGETRQSEAGITLQPNMGRDYPRLTAVAFETGRQQPSIGVNETLILHGVQLRQNDQATWLHFSHPHLPDDDGWLWPIEPPADDRLEVQIPNEWPAGAYTVTAAFSKGDETPSGATNALPFSLAPTVDNVEPKELTIDGGEPAYLYLTCTQPIAKRQQVSLFLGDREFRQASHKERTYTLTFAVADVELGEHLVRLRVDGVDSHVIDYDQTPPMFLADAPRVRIV